MEIGGAEIRQQRFPVFANIATASVAKREVDFAGHRSIFLCGF
jgi:hypothetical protein